jgi:D-arabinose 1-dehydrogenase-like Zn-dependent alcohol dehydrogenase
LHKAKLIPIPDHMSDAIAASYTIGSQTSYSMVRRTQVVEGDEALILSARSNTSMFIMKALIAHKVKVTALTTTEWTEEEKSCFKGVSFIQIPRGGVQIGINMHCLVCVSDSLMPYMILSMICTFPRL